LLKGLSIQIFNISKDKDPTAFLGKQCKDLATFKVKKIFLKSNENFSHCKLGSLLYCSCASLGRVWLHLLYNHSQNHRIRESQNHRI